MPRAWDKKNSHHFLKAGPVFLRLSCRHKKRQAFTNELNRMQFLFALYEELTGGGIEGYESITSFDVQ